MVCLVSWKGSIPALVKKKKKSSLHHPCGLTFFFFSDLYFSRNLVGSGLCYPGYVKILTFPLVVGNLAQVVPWRWEQPARGKRSGRVAANWGLATPDVEQTLQEPWQLCFESLQRFITMQQFESWTKLINIKIKEAKHRKHWIFMLQNFMKAVPNRINESAPFSLPIHTSKVQSEIISPSRQPSRPLKADLKFPQLQTLWNPVCFWALQKTTLWFFSWVKLSSSQIAATDANSLRIFGQMLWIYWF